ncbi:hypothetical protein BDR07DRAFT_1493293 [Suillus spraguei]|nr:hypothetical protein BDR07DRAFT_1493293 [Suillus spraguei]
MQQQDESHRLMMMLTTKIVEVLNGSSTVKVIKEGILNYRLLHKARLRISIELSACLASEIETPDCVDVVSDAEIRRAALTIAHAMLNMNWDWAKDYVNWDAERYGESVKLSQPNHEGLPTGEPERLRKYFHETDLGKISEPATIVDRHGKILTIYLPNILSPSRVQLKGCVNCFFVPSHPPLAAKVPWRSKGFCAPQGGGEFGAGRITISPAYFMQRQERIQDPLVTSAAYSSAEVQAWLSALATTEFFWNAITAAVAPDLFQAGSAAILGAQCETSSKSKASPAVSRWPSVFSGLEVIVNRVTLSHRDGGGAPTLYDLLVSLGIGHTATMKLADVGAELDYFPGTMVYISGILLEHSVGPWANGERFVIAHFMKDKVHDRMKVPRPPFPMQRFFLEMVGKDVSSSSKK